MNLNFIDWIWHVRGSLPLAAGQSSDEVFDRLDPLFRQTGTSHERTGDTLVFAKKDQAAQDKMSVFDGGVVRVEKGADGGVLRYHLTSRALLFCFLAPLLFLGLSQLVVNFGKMPKPEAESAGKAGDKKKPEVLAKLHPIDVALGAPAPEKKKDKSEKDKKPSPTPAYVFAAIFATLYGVGRILEDRLVRMLFRKSLLGA